MTTAEMNRRLATLTSEQINDILRMIRQGYGAHGIKCESPYSLKQINAVFEYVEWGRREEEKARREDPVWA